MLNLRDEHYAKSLISLAFKLMAIVLVTQEPSCGQVSIQPIERMRLAQQEVKLNPKDAKKRFELGESFRQVGNLKQAVIEYLDVTSLDPAYYIAYHELVRSKPNADQLEEAFDRLTKLEEEKPKSLMLRIALSEVLEQKGDFYAAARTLVDLQYAHGIPDKYWTRINGRIHYLLSKARDIETTETAQKAMQTQEDIDATPIPLPESSPNDGLSANKLKQSKIEEGYGHARLLP